MLRRKPYPLVATPKTKLSRAKRHQEKWRHTLIKYGLLPYTAPHVGMKETQAEFDQFIGSDIFKEIMTRARHIEPALGSRRQIHKLLAAPFYDAIWSPHAHLKARFPQAHYDTIVCVPWIREGGADLVACLLARAIKDAGDGRVLILRTDNLHFERPDWVPADVDCISMADFKKQLTTDDGQKLLYAVFVGLQPKRIINVNSRLCWMTFSRFGRQLARYTRLYAYLFCWDQTPDGRRVGYPSEFYPEQAALLSGVFTDTDYLRNELIRLNDPPPEIAARLIPLYTPSADSDVAEAVVARTPKGAHGRPLYLWAGRLDRQKRFDLVHAIARAMPEADFRCWGTSLLDAPPDLTRLPPNITMQGSFKTWSDLPLSEADAWLFTSAWEGMPTILIELALRGMPIVASAVGGVPELITPHTGWPIADIERVDSYVEALRAASTSPSESASRGDRLRARAVERHSIRAYQQKLDEVFGREAPT